MTEEAKIKSTIFCEQMYSDQRYHFLVTIQRMKIKVSLPKVQLKKVIAEFRTSNRIHQTHGYLLPV